MTDAQPVPTDPQALAEAVTAAMWSRDRTAQALGMRIESVTAGSPAEAESTPQGLEGT